MAYTRDGRFLASSGTDRRLRLWHASSGKNTLVHFPETRNKNKICRFALSADSSVVYYPNGLKVVSFELESGRKVQELTGHFDQVHCLAANPMVSRPACELYSGGKDQTILAWTPLASVGADGEEKASRRRNCGAGEREEGRELDGGLDYNPLDADDDALFASLDRSIEQQGEDDSEGLRMMGDAPSTDDEDEWSDTY